MNQAHNQTLTLPFSDISAADLPQVGGKGANLGILTRAGIRVPPGFCVTTRAYQLFVGSLPEADAHFAALDALDGSSVEAARAAAEAMRHALDGLAVPAAVAEAVSAAWRELGVAHPLAVRSSATAEDLPGASFAGQQDTYLNIQGEAALLDAVRRCWVSLFTDRAVLYRARGGFGHREVGLSVVVQRLVDPEVSGILFTADPISGHRGMTSIDAGFGLGEALVGGLISADLYRVDRRREQVILAQPGDKAFAIRSVPGGGTRQEPLPEAQRQARALDDPQVLALARIGAQIEAAYGGVPQDIEWCIAGGTIYVVQARPITSLFPIPPHAGADDGLRVYLSFGHFQMMLDAMPRVAREVWQLFLPVGKGGLPTLADRPTLSAVMVSAGSRLFVDATAALRVAPTRKLLLTLLGNLYEALAQSTARLAAEPEFARRAGDPIGVITAALRTLGPIAARVPLVLLVRDPARGGDELRRAQDEIPRAARARIASAPTPAGRIRQCAVELNAIFSAVRLHLAPILGGLVAHRLLGRIAPEHRADLELLLRGLPGNVTTEMDLLVGDLTDRVRSYPALAELLREKGWAEIRTRIPEVPGGPDFLAAFDAFLDRYGNRGASEIDISRSRWRDDPALLLRVITGGLSVAEPGSHRKKHEAQVALAEAAAARITAAGRGLRGIIQRRLVRVARAGMGLRESPKFILISVFALVRAEVLVAGETLARRGQIAAAGAVWHLGFDEIAQALDDESIDLRAQVAARAEEFALDRRRKVPIVISSEGETPTLAVDRADLPPGALAGTAASAGVVEGIARVVTDPDREVLHAGEILVAPFTDPGWTPLFVHAAGVVTEVGGLMTHGAVVAREYGIPAVVSVANALSRIKSGQRIRVDGTRGFVEILDETAQNSPETRPARG